MTPVRNLRSIKDANAIATSMQEDSWVDWKINSYYEQYLKRIMAMPERTIAPAFSGDAKELELGEDKTFTEVKARWLDDNLGSGSEDDEGEEDDGDGWFGADPFNLAEHLFPNGPFPFPGMWNSEYDTDSEHESYDDDYDSDSDSDENMPDLVSSDHHWGYHDTATEDDGWETESENGMPDLVEVD
jgi:hypothetical protein